VSLRPGDTVRARRARGETLVALGFGLSALASLGLAVTYLLGGQVQAEGILLGVALGGLAMGIGVFANRFLPPGPDVEDRGVVESTDAQREAFEKVFEQGEEPIRRRRFLLRMLGAAVGALGVAALFPIRSLGPRPGRSLFRTAWEPGLRVVTEQGRLVRADEMNVGEVLTVFPEGHAGRADSQTVLIRLESGRIDVRGEREGWAPDGHVAYSKICTHAGCPVGLYETSTNQLLCPCHQSAFDVIDEAKPIFGPATRALPQLPLEIDFDGYLRAQGDFSEPVGPGFWNQP
jgi:ubiquinol-cytochrome c reductase iron-sulfur subunit